jgi:hypothetical protein
MPYNVTHNLALLFVNSQCSLLPGYGMNTERQSLSSNQTPLSPKQRENECILTE